MNAVAIVTTPKPMTRKLSQRDPTRLKITAETRQYASPLFLALDCDCILLTVRRNFNNNVKNAAMGFSKR